MTEPKTPKSELLMQEILTGFRGIRTENGYNSDLGRNIFEARDDEAIPESELPALNLNGLPMDTVITIGAHEHHLVVSGELRLGSKITDLQKIEPPQMLRLLMADITTCVGQNLTWGELAEDTSVINEEDVKMIHVGGKLAGAKFNFTVDYVTEPFNPYE